MVAGERATRRDATISADLWKRVQRDGLADRVWIGGTIRLEADPACGLPEVHITGVSFSQASVQRLVDRHGGSVSVTPKPAPPPGPTEPTTAPIDSNSQRSAPSAIPADAVTVTVKPAMAMLGLGRTKINELMNDGRLIKKKIDGRTLIEIASIRLLAGTST